MEVIDFRPSRAAQGRVSELLRRNREGQITDEEKLELDQYVELEQIMRMAMARARRILGAID